MKSFRSVALSCALLAPAASGSAAQLPVLDASAPSSVVEYRSAFEDYRPYREEARADWRSVNEEVARAGGHAGIMRGAKASAPSPRTRPVERAPHAGAHAH